MFSLTLHDHLRLIFGQVTQRHQAHTTAARVHERWSRRLRGTEALLVGLVAMAATAAAFGRGQIFAIVAAALAGAALVVFLVHLTFGFDGSARAHAECGARLWRIRERYRALLADLNDGVLDMTEARLRRDRLLEELAAIYENTPVLAAAPGGEASDVSQTAQAPAA